MESYFYQEVFDFIKLPHWFCLVKSLFFGLSNCNIPNNLGLDQSLIHLATHHNTQEIHITSVKIKKRHILC